MRQNDREKDGRKKRRARCLALLLAGLTAAMMTGCGKGQENGNGGNGGKVQTKEWVYVPEFLELEEENASFYEMRVFGDSLYYVSYNYDESGENSGRPAQTIRRYSLTDKSTTDLNIPMESSENGGEPSEDGSYSGQSINGFAPLEDGGIAVVFDYYTSDGNENYESWRSFAKFDADGNEIFNLDLRELTGDDEQNGYVRNILVDGQGRFYLPAENKVWLIDAEGRAAGAASLSGGSESWIQGSGISKDGKVYICYYTNGVEGDTLAEVDFDKKGLGNVYENFPRSNGEALSAGIEKDFLTHDGTSVFEYDLETQEKEELFDWLDSDINGSFVRGMSVLEDGRIVAMIQDWSTDENSIALLTKTPGSEVAQKETIVIGAMSPGSGLQAAAVKFNRSSDKYHISIKEYVDYDTWTETTWSDALTNLNNDLTSANCPDIIDLSGLNVSQLAAKGVFEDLSPMLEKSEVLSREDFLENVLEAYTYDGKLVCIPASFQMSTVIGRTSDVGTEMGWTLDEMIAYADAHPDAELFDSTTKANMLHYCMMYNEDSFIDWENTSCSFDSQEFKDLLTFVNRFPEDWDYSDDRPSEPTRIQNGEVLLAQAGIYSFEEIQMYYEIFGGEITCIGLPTTDGGAGCAMSATDEYAITSKSGAKEAAWSFIESYLDTKWDNANNYHNFGFPTEKKALEEMAAEVVKVEYVTDENGDPVLDEEGNPVVMGGSSSVGYQDGWEYTYHTPTQEEVDLVMELVKVAKPISYGNDEIYNIINEEAEAFFKGQKSVDDVAGIIQSRIQVYVSENS